MKPAPPQERALVVTASVFYLIMTAVGLVIIGAQGLAAVPAVFGDGANGATDTLLGAASGLAVVFATWLTRDLGPVKRLNHELSAVLGRPSSGSIAVLAVGSAVGEEVFFRGALQPLIGFWPTVLIFGLLHGGLQKKLRIWAVFATLAGILLGWLAETTGNLLAPILCHLTVNFWNLHAMADDEPESA